MDEKIKNKIEEKINSADLVLFMKGTKDMPMCGFSRHVVLILNEINAEFNDFNVLEDDELRSGLKEYSQWPTFPQLYYRGELVGGCDIVNEMFESGEIQELLK